MFRVMDIDAEGQVAVHEGEAFIAPPDDGTIRWIDLTKQDPSQLALLAERFKFHPLTIEDCLHFDQRPKLESYADYVFLVTHGFKLSDAEDDLLDLLELHSFWGRRFLVTVHAEPISAMETVWERIKADGAMGRRGIDFIVYLVSDAIVDSYFPLLDDISARVEDAEDHVLERTRKIDLSDIFQLKRALVHLRKILSPQRDVFALLAKRGDSWIDERTSLYFRDIYDHLLRLHEWTETTRDLLSNALDAYLWAESQRTNEIMKRLTLLSAIFMPLTFITGFWGQNFTALPFGSRIFLTGTLASCALVPLAMFLFFRRSKWF